MTDSLDHDTHRNTGVRATVRSQQVAPQAGTWEICDHGRCGASGMLRALTLGETAPLCPLCGRAVRLQLTQLAPNTASGHAAGQIRLDG